MRRTRDEVVCEHGIGHPVPGESHHGGGIHGCSEQCSRGGCHNKILAGKLLEYIHPRRRGRKGTTYLNATDGHFCDGWECDFPSVPEDIIKKAAEVLNGD